MKFIEFSNRKNSLESRLYNIKNKIQVNSNFNKITYNNKNVLECLQEIEDKVNENHQNIFDLSPLEEYLDKIIKEITPKDMAERKAKILKQINEYLNEVALEKEKIDKKENNKINENSINGAKNMLNNFKNKFYLILDVNELYNTNTEFENEKIKYFD